MMHCVILCIVIVLGQPGGRIGRGSTGTSSSGGGGGQNFHVQFGDNCNGNTYTVNSSVFTNSWLSGSGTYVDHSDYWSSYSPATIPTGFCTSSDYAPDFSSSTFDYIAPEVTTSGSVTTHGMANHDMENYCSAEGGSLPPFLGSTFGETTYTISLTPSNQAWADISNTVGVAINGIVIFSPYTGVGSVAPEDETLDTCSGHPANGNYHYHGYPNCLADEIGDDAPLTANPSHSSILGWSFDGFPIYGPWGYSDPFDTSSNIINVRSGYACSNSVDCTDHTNWSWSESNGELDECNGRWGKTPEFPEGIYYFVFTVKEENGHIHFPGVPYCTGTASTQTSCPDDTTTESPTVFPTSSAPTKAPNILSSTHSPSRGPTQFPSRGPTKFPSQPPTQYPTVQSTATTTQRPSTQPTAMAYTSFTPSSAPTARVVNQYFRRFRGRGLSEREDVLEELSKMKKLVEVQQNFVEES